MIEGILKQIEIAKKELMCLKSELEREGLKKYQYLIGKYYSLAVTCKIKITDIYSVDDHYNSISIECIRIQGGKSDCGRIEIKQCDDYSLSFIDIDEERITEITKEQFISFLEEALNETKQYTIKAL